MPYKIEKQKDKWCVMNTDTGENKGCSDSEDMAKQHMNALYANEKKPGKKEMSMLTQAETNYSAAGGMTGKACSNCRWFCPADDMEEAHCHLVSEDPAPIVSNGLCDRWEAQPAMDSEPAPIPVTIVDEMDSEEMALPTTRKGLIEVVTDAVKSILNPDEPAFSVFKVNGKKYWISRHTGKWKDREDEIIANHSHDEYVARAQSGKIPLPELWTWHKKGSKHGQADMVWKSGGFTLALGHFDDTPEADKAFQFYQKNRGKIKLSHMFNYPKRAKQGRVFHAYNTVEITTLPDGAEAFPYTSFEELDMSLTDTQRAFIKELGGDEMLKRVETADTKALADSNKLDALGVESKGLDNFEGSSIPQDDSVKALETKQAALETRLKAIEQLPELFDGVKKLLTTLNKQISALEQSNTANLEKANLLEKKLLEYQTVQPPASRSQDTILNEREKSLIDMMAEAAKTADGKSLVELMAGY